jgi:putative ABC transport system permease protein
MRTPLAWKNVTHNKVRAAASLAGVGFAIVLIFMQMGFYDACFRSSTMVFDQLDFDIALVSPQYVHLRAPGAIPRRRIYQARSLPGVARVSPFFVGNALWRSPETGFQREMLVLAVDPREHPFRLPELIAAAELLKKEDTVVIDTKAQKAYAAGALHVGDKVELEHRDLEVVATYGYGCGFISDASVLVSDRTLARIVPGYPLESVSVGFIQLKPGANREAVIQALEAELPKDVEVLRREQLDRHEQDYFVKTKPLGIMFSSGVLLAFAVGAVILYQVLASEVMNRLKEYATLKAIGYSNGFMNLVIFQQATIFAFMGFVPALLLSLGLYKITQFSTNLPMVMTPQRVAFVLVLSVVMCGMSGMLASRKVSRADPADLF